MFIPEYLFIMKIIINERQYKRLILESFEFGDVKTVVDTINVYSQDEYNIMMLYYNFMNDAYKYVFVNILSGSFVV